MDMIEERLKAYRSEKEEIQELRYKLNHLGDGESMIGNSTIMDYQKGYPRPQSVIGYDHEREERLRNTYLSRIEKLTKRCEEVESWVEAIPDSLTRRIFRMYYLEGKTQHQIAKKIHIHQSNVSRKVEEYLKLHKMHKKM